MPVSSPRRRRATAALLPLLLLAACDRPGGATAAAPPPPKPVRVETVRLEPAVPTLRYAAVLRPRIESELGFRVGGKLVARQVEVGHRVEAGAVLARLDPADLELQVHAVEAQLASARADAANAAADHGRYAALRRGEWTTQQEFDRRRTVMETAQARVRQVEAELRVARNNAQYAALVADAPGVVTAVLAEPGQVVAAGQTVFRVARLGEIEAVAGIPEQQRAALESSRLTVELWSGADRPIAGRLRELAPMADGATRTYQARVTLLDPPAAAQLGMTATLTIAPAVAPLVARLPATALAKQGEAPALWVLDAAGERIALRPVQVAAYAGDRVIVSGGVAEGERVVTAGVHKLDAAQRVRIWTEPER